MSSKKTGSSPENILMNELMVSHDIKSFIANELDDGVLNDDGSISFKWEGKDYIGFLSVVRSEGFCEPAGDAVAEPKKYNGGLNPSLFTR